MADVKLISVSTIDNMEIWLNSAQIESVGKQVSIRGEDTVIKMGNGTIYQVQEMPE